MDPIVLILGFIGFAIVSAISNILEKRQRKQQEEEARRTGGPLPEHEPEPDEPPPQTWPGGDWQEQLRRLLNPDEAPPVIQQPPREQRPASPTQPQPPVQRSEPPRQPRHPRHPQAPHRTPPSRTPPPLQPASMAPSATMYEAAAGLQKQVAERVRQMEKKSSDMRKEMKSGMSAHGPSRPPRHHIRERTAPSRRAVRWVQDPLLVRDAYVASVILGPPKALEQPSPNPLPAS